MDTTTMLWEGSGKFWQLSSVSTISAIQLFSHDLTRQSGMMFLNDEGKRVVLDAAIQIPWSPASRLG